jgi:hypothetical protein
MQKLKVKAEKRWSGLNQSATVIAKKGAQRAFNSHCSLLEALFSSLFSRCLFLHPLTIQVVLLDAPEQQHRSTLTIAIQATAVLFRRGFQ